MQIVSEPEQSGLREPTFVTASFITPRKDEEPVFYGFEVRKRKYIILIYYALFALADYIPLAILSRVFLRSERGGRDFEEVRDLRYAAFFAFLLGSAGVTFGWGQAGPELARFWRGLPTSQNSAVFVACDVGLWVCQLALLEDYSVSSVMMVARVKFGFAIAVKILKKFPQTNKELRFLSCFVGFVFAIYLFGGTDFASIFALLGSGALLFFCDSVLGVSQSFKAAQLHYFTSLAVMVVLFLLRSLLNASHWSLTPIELLLGVLASIAFALRLWVLGRIKLIQNDSRGEVYNEINIVFVALIAVTLDLLLLDANDNWPQFLAGLFLLAALVAYRRREIKALLLAVRQTSNAEPILA